MSNSNPIKIPIRKSNQDIVTKNFRFIYLTAVKCLTYFQKTVFYITECFVLFCNNNNVAKLIQDLLIN